MEFSSSECNGACLSTDNKGQMNAFLNIFWATEVFFTYDEVLNLLLRMYWKCVL